ncbi:hypothetical protein D6C97_03477 [Aureobasidium pullulans]|nr:hypothetical protein D6C97_03477 [Aureobasidium pullulans]
MHFTKKTTTSTKKTTTSTKKAVVTTAQKPVTTTSRKPVTSTTKKPTTSTTKKPYAEAYINKHEEAYLDKHKETHLDKHKEIYLDEHDEACIDQHEEGYNSCIFKRKDDINEREASHIGKLKEAHDNHDEASNNQSQGFNFKHQESFNNQLKEMSKEFVCLGVSGAGTRWVLGTIGVQMNLDIGTKMQELCRIFFH